MFSEIALCNDAKSCSVTGIEFHVMQETTRFSLSHCLQHSVAVIHLGADPENNVTHGNPVFCSSNNTYKKRGGSLFVSHVHNRRYGNTNEITLCLPHSSTCIRQQIICHLQCLDDIKACSTTVKMVWMP